MLVGRDNDELDEDDELDTTDKPANVPAGWRKPNRPPSNAAAARRFAGAKTAPDTGGGDPGDESDGSQREAMAFVDEMFDGAPPTSTTNAAEVEEQDQQALQLIQQVVLQIAARYASSGRNKIQHIFEDADFRRLLPAARVVDATTIDIGNGSLVDIVDRKAAPTSDTRGAQALLRDRLDGTLGGNTGAAPAGDGPVYDEALSAKMHAERKAAEEFAAKSAAGAGDYFTVPPAMAADMKARGVGGGLADLYKASRGQAIKLPTAYETMPFRPADQLVPQRPPQIELAEVTHQDLDQLWDWSRQDPNGVRDFLGNVPAHTQALYNWLYGVLTLQNEKRARINSIVVNRRLFGFVALMPIERPEGGEHRASVHLYLEPGVRGSLPQLLPALMQIAEVAEPGLTLMITTQRQEWARMLQGVGFSSSLVLTRRPRGGVKG